MLQVIYETPTPENMWYHITYIPIHILTFYMYYDIIFF